MVMELRPRRNEVLRCGYCLDNVPNNEAVFLKETGSYASYATLAVHDECFDEVNRGALRFVKAPLAYGIAEQRPRELTSLDLLSVQQLLDDEASWVGDRLVMSPDSSSKIALPEGGRVSGVVLKPTQIASGGLLRLRNKDKSFVNVYEPLSIKADDAEIRLCLHDSLGLKIVRGLVFSSGRQLTEGSYHSSAHYSTGLVTIEATGVMSVVYDRGHFVDVEGGITLSAPPSSLPKHLHPKMGRRRGRSEKD